MKDGISGCAKHWRAIAWWGTAALILMRLVIAGAKIVLGAETVVEVLDMFGLHAPNKWLDDALAWCMRVVLQILEVLVVLLA